MGGWWRGSRFGFRGQWRCGASGVRNGKLTGMGVVAVGATVAPISGTAHHGRVADVVIDTKAVVVVVAALVTGGGGGGGGGGGAVDGRWRARRPVALALGVHEEEAGDAGAAVAARVVVVGHLVVVLAEEAVVAEGELVAGHQLALARRAAEALDVVDLVFGPHHKVRPAET